MHLVGLALELLDGSVGLERQFGEAATLLLPQLVHLPLELLEVRQHHLPLLKRGTEGKL